MNGHHRQDHRRSERQPRGMRRDDPDEMCNTRSWQPTSRISRPPGDLSDRDHHYSKASMGQAPLALRSGRVGRHRWVKWRPVKLDEKRLNRLDEPLVIRHP